MYRLRFASPLRNGLISQFILVLLWCIRMHPNKASFVPVVCGSGLSDKSSSDSAADVSPLSKKTGGEAARILLLERMLPTRLSSLV